jgi:hypothetical protein
MKKIEDYLKYYIGRKAVDEDGNHYTVDLVTALGSVSMTLVSNTCKGKSIGSFDRYQLLLRPLSSMTEEEMRAVWQIVFDKPFHASGRILWIDKEDRRSAKRWVLMSGVDRLGIEMTGTVWADIDLGTYKFNPNHVSHYLLSCGFDLFNLIEIGLAIPETVNKENQ